MTHLSPALVQPGESVYTACNTRMPINKGKSHSSRDSKKPETSHFFLPTKAYFQPLVYLTHQNIKPDFSAGENPSNFSFSQALA